MKNIYSEKLKILLITSRSDMGGGAKHVLDLCRGLKSLRPNIEISIASPDDRPFYESFINESIQHLTIPHRLFSLIAFLRLLTFCRSNGIQIVHSHGRGAGIYSKFLSLFGLKVVHTFHGAHVEDSFVGKAKASLDYLLRNSELNYICVSHDEKENVVALNWTTEEKIKVIHNGVDLEFLSRQFNSLNQQEARQKWELPTNKKIYGTLARLTYQKGIELLIQSVFELKEKTEELLFVIAGAGEDESRLKEQLQKLNIKNILFLGEVSDPALFLRCLDGYFSFARWEGFPISVVEAIALKVPCILSDVIGHRDFNSMSTLFDSMDSEGFLHKLIELKRNDSANFHLTIENMAKETLEYYQKIAD